MTGRSCYRAVTLPCIVQRTRSRLRGARSRSRPTLTHRAEPASHSPPETRPRRLTNPTAKADSERPIELLRRVLELTRRLEAVVMFRHVAAYALGQSAYRVRVLSVSKAIETPSIKHGNVSGVRYPMLDADDWRFRGRERKEMPQSAWPSSRCQLAP